jgi:hypothetical protein
LYETQKAFQEVDDHERILPFIKDTGKNLNHSKLRDELTWALVINIENRRKKVLCGTIKKEDGKEVDEYKEYMQ